MTCTLTEVKHRLAAAVRREQKKKLKSTVTFKSTTRVRDEKRQKEIGIRVTWSKKRPSVVSEKLLGC
jgi:hypothetical protein